MEAQCREQANDSFWHTLRHLCQSMVFPYFRAGQPIQPAPNPFELTAFYQSGKVLAWNADTIQVTRAYNTLLANECKELARKRATLGLNGYVTYSRHIYIFTYNL